VVGDGGSKASGLSWQGIVAVYAALVVTIIVCTLIMGLRFNWWVSAVWMVGMVVATYYWHRWRVS
jgi:hypothetical protein